MWNKKEEGRFLFALLAPSDTSIVESVIYSVVTVKSGRGVRITVKRYMHKKTLVLLHTLNNIQITNYFDYKPMFNGIFQEKLFYLE